MERSILIALVVIVLATGFVAVTVLVGSQDGKPIKTEVGENVEGVEEVRITVRGGEIEISRYGYAVDSEELRSPGPDIRVKVGSRVRVTFVNVGKLPHTFAITSEKKFDAEPLWGASIGSPTEPIQGGGVSSITFRPQSPGEYFYICQVPGHIELGMWGRFIAE